ncbi:hypothetical protein [Bacillus sp. PK3_68]|uniref:hypothetical protein n=1 Tax=Bacillus sp. PK3_68 TaxID=2027408 RepID=UPI000E723DB5|nr:hypothetical protein [Bacillus sp. PK3_68]RJS61752.1 hypothetical protein CJ483_18335 [Bacillus sp. PK3_68]
MNNLLNKLAANAVFVIIAGLASIVSLVVAFINDKQILWIILTINSFLLLVVWKLVSQNSVILGRLDNIDFYVLQREIELEEDEDEKYVSKGDVILALQASLSQESLSAQPQATIEISYPSQLQIEYIFNSERIRRDSANSDKSKFNISLSHGISFIALRSISIGKENENDFLRSSRQIIVKVQSDLLSESKEEIIPVSLVG